MVNFSLFDETQGMQKNISLFQGLSSKYSKRFAVDFLFIGSAHFY